MRVLSRAAVLAGVGVGAVAVRRMAATRQVDVQHLLRPDTTNRWLAVTVNRSPQQIGSVESLPEPLTRLREKIEIRIRPATGDKGTELMARPREPVPGGVVGVAARVAGEDPRQEVRFALRAAKSIIETGEMLKPDPKPSTHPRTPAGKILAAANRLSRGEGRL